MVSFETGELIIFTKTNGYYDVSNMEFDDLTFVDFVDDVYLNRAGSLNNAASIISVQLINGVDSDHLKNLIELTETDSETGLYYLIVYEGKNVAQELIGTPIDYHAQILTIFGSETIASVQRQLTSNYNASVLQTIYAEQLAPGEWLSFQIVVWGDYDILVNPYYYLSRGHTMQMTVKTTQWEGEIG